MKYGLRNDKNHSSKMKWKISMENDIATLKEEVSTLKHQLRSSLDIINLLVHKNSTESTVKEVKQGVSSMKIDESNNIENNDYKYINLEIEAPVEIKLQHDEYRKATPEPILSTRYKTTEMKELGDVFTNKRLNCITSMPEYRYWSRDELRLAYYKAAYYKKQLFYNDDLKGVLTGSGFIKYSPLRDYDPVSGRIVGINCISAHPCFQSKSLEELRLEDYSLKRLIFPRQNDPFGDRKIKKPSKRMSVNNSPKQEELLNKIILQLGKMDTKLTSVNSQISTMDTNLSEIRSQMSMVDSRLSAVDMFVTMQRMDKNWQGLSSSLQSLERVESQKQIKTAPSCSIQNNNSQSPSATKKTLNNSILKVITSALRHTDKNDLSKEIQFIATEDTILITHSPMIFGNFSLKQSSDIQTADSLNLEPNELVCLEETSQGDNELSPLKGSVVDIPSRNFKLNPLKESEVDISPRSNKLSPLEENEADIPPRSNKLSPLKGSEADIPSRNNKLSPLKGSEADITSRNNKLSPLKGSEADIPSINNSQLESNITFQLECDNEDEFVIVDKSDAVDICGQSSKEDSSSKNSNSTTDYNITEYLEVNAGKRKDLVYEFGCEAKPADWSIGSKLDCNNISPSQDSSETSPTISVIKDDSFLLCIDRLIESKTVHQSTPVPSSKQLTKISSEKLKISEPKDIGNS